MGAIKLYLNYCNNYNAYMQRRRVIIGIAICVVLLWYKSQQGRLNRRRVKYGPLLPRNLEREARLNRLYNGTEASCLSELRMQNAVFHRLCHYLRSRAMLVDTSYVSIEEQVSMFMHVVGHRWTNRSVGFEFMRSGETVSRHFHAVLDALCALSRDLITIRTTDTHPKISISTGRFHPYFEEKGPEAFARGSNSRSAKGRMGRLHQDCRRIRGVRQRQPHGAHPVRRCPAGHLPAARRRCRDRAVHAPGVRHHLRLYEWRSAGWAPVFDVLRIFPDDCAFPTVCGAYGVCTDMQCSCPDAANFRPLDFQRPNCGCVPAALPASCAAPRRA